MSSIRSKFSPLLVGFLAAVLVLVVMGAYTNFGGINSVSPLRVNSEDIVKSLTVKFDSLGAAQDTILIFAPHRAITLLAVDLFTGTAFVGINTNDSADAQVTLRQGAATYTARMDSGARFQTTDLANVDYSAAACTLSLIDGGGNGTGGVKGTAVLWFTDK